jgi:hypothetical protein
LTRQYVYDLMWPNGSIGENYASDFKFDMNEFGYQFFSWRNDKAKPCLYILVSGISA